MKPSFQLDYSLHGLPILIPQLQGQRKATPIAGVWLSNMYEIQCRIPRFKLFPANYGRRHPKQGQLWKGSFGMINAGIAGHISNNRNYYRPISNHLLLDSSFRHKKRPWGYHGHNTDCLESPLVDFRQCTP